MLFAGFAALLSRIFAACALFGFCLALFHVRVLYQVVIAIVVAWLYLSRALGTFRGGAFANFLLGEGILGRACYEERDGE